MAKLKQPDDDINAAFEKKESESKKLKAKQNFLADFIDDNFIDNPLNILKGDKRLEKKLNDFNFNKFSVLFTVDNGNTSKDVLKITANVMIDDKKIVLTKQLK